MRPRVSSASKWICISWPGCIVIVRGMHSNPGTRLKVRSLGVGAKPLGAVVRIVRVPFGFVMRMVLGSGWVKASFELEMTGRMNCSGVCDAASTVAMISTLDWGVVRESLRL